MCESISHRPPSGPLRKSELKGGGDVKEKDTLTQKHYPNILSLIFAPVTQNIIVTRLSRDGTNVVRVQMDVQQN